MNNLKKVYLSLIADMLYMIKNIRLTMEDQLQRFGLLVGFLTIQPLIIKWLIPLLKQNSENPYLVYLILKPQGNYRLLNYAINLYFTS